MFIDEAVITVHGGDGGKGFVHFFPGKNGPDGGDGGKGGNVYAVINPQLVSLYKYLEKKSFKAENGTHGQSNRRSGATGQDLFLEMPIGVYFTDLKTGEEIELTPEVSPLLLVTGGEGGLGNNSFKSSTNQTPMNAEPGKDGQTRQFKVVLKLIADYGLIGLPNAGKSSLLNELTAAHVKTANYAFTTLEPNLGVLFSKVIADIPGLIEGASQGKGLGIKFLKHIEKVTLLLHCISADSENLEADYHTVISELEKYNPNLIKKKSVLLLTKIDMVSPDEVKKKLKILKKYNKDILPISIHDYDSIEKLKEILLKA